MNQKHLSNIAILSKERNTTKEIDVEKIINHFANVKSRKTIFYLFLFILI